MKKTIKKTDNTLLVKPAIINQKMTVKYYKNYDNNKYEIEHRAFTEFWASLYTFQYKKDADKWYNYMMKAIKSGRSAAAIYADYTIAITA